ncbi:MAG TPA: hypothetical protein VKZ79_04800 [Alphaproteobacteria bacterium]|nr:hypothetical protein [Alphaproteobacteria bacterium]
MSSSTASVAAQAAAPSQPSTASNTAAQASLNRLMAKYKSEIARNPSAQDLSSLARQITAAAKALGQHVTLPKASASAGAAESASESPKSSVDLKA